MTTYKEIQGYSIQSVGSDPSLDEGQVWYNNASYAIKLASLTTVGTWASGGNLGTARHRLAGTGTQTAGLAFGGAVPPPSVHTVATEEYNGTSWSPGGNLGTSRYGVSGTGTQTAALAFGGGRGGPVTNSTELYNGTAWTSPPATLNSERVDMGEAGNQTASLGFGGYAATGRSTATESWNGSTWTTVNSMNTARNNLASCGVQTAALAYGGALPGSASTDTEAWNGTSWTNVTSMGTARRGGAGFGIQTAAVATAGNTNLTGPSITGITELYNGSTWSANPNSLATARGNGVSGAGTQASGLVFGGFVPPDSAATEEWTGPGVPQTQTITTS